jgi:capsular polysaccharide transport system ATP-binding protein
LIELINVCKDYPIQGGNRRILDNVCFTLKRGERLGVLGHNGAGKSTLIRVVGGAEPPTSGRVKRGMSVSWPLAFGGGFHPSLSGADNLRFICRIYNADYRSSVGFVEDFAELGSYFYEPMRTYSSGMRARLAFAISMTIDFDCLLIDEIVAVGDERFKERCQVELFEKRSDRTMIIVSHGQKFIKDNCTRFALLNNGALEEHENFRLCYHEYKKLLQSRQLTPLG